MDKIKNYVIISLIFLILLGLCTLFGYLYYNEKNKPANQIISTITEVQIDTIQFTDSLYFPNPIYIEKPVIPQNIDTSATIHDYYSGKIYEYNFKDSNLSIKSNIIIHKNQLVSLFNEYEIYRKTTTITNTITQPAPELMALIGAGFDVYNYKLGLNLTAGVYYKKNILSIYYDPLLKSFGIVYKRAIIIK